MNVNFRLRQSASPNAVTNWAPTASSRSKSSSKDTGCANLDRLPIDACSDFTEPHSTTHQVDADDCLSQASYYQNCVQGVQTKLEKKHRNPNYMKKTTVESVLREHSIFVKKRPRCLLNHQGRFIRNWDMITFVGLIYTAVVTPVEVAFLDEKVWSFMFWLNQWITLVFVLDMVFQFFLPFETEGLVGICTVTNHKKIALHYLKGWFFLDLCSVLPLDTIGSATGSEGMKRLKIVRFLRLLRLLKMIRLLRASRIFARWQTILAISYTTQSLWKFGMMLIMGSHWISCIWGIVGQEQEAYSWVNALEDNKPNGMPLRDDPFNLYLASLHFAVMTITSIGFGDIVPQQRIEYIFAIVIQCAGGMLWAYSMGEVMVVVSNLNPGSTLFKQRMDELNRMMKERKLPVEMKRRLRAFFLQSRELRQADRYTSLLMQMSPQLQGEVARTTNMRWISKVWYLRPQENPLDPIGISDYLIARIAVGLKVRVYAQTEAVRSDDTLNVLTRGLASSRGKLLRVGELWGEDFILEHRPLRRLNIVLALTFIEVQELQRHVFQDILDNYANACDYKIIRKAVVKLALIRGAVLHARHVRAQRHRDAIIDNRNNAPLRSQEQESRLETLEADSRCHSASSNRTVSSGPDPPPREMTDEFKKEMRAIIRSEMRAVMASHVERLANANRAANPRHDALPAEHARPLSNHCFGDEIVTFLRMPTMPGQPE